MGDAEQALSTPKRYRKKPVVVEALQWQGIDTPISTLEKWMGRKLKAGDLRPGAAFLTQASGHLFLNICTLEGQMVAEPGDWIIKGVAGEFYPCKPEIFAVTYEEATDG